MNRGLIRIFVVFSIVWLGYFGWQAYDANYQVGRAKDSLQTIANQLKLGQLPANSRSETFAWKVEQQVRLNQAVKFAVVGEVGGLFVLLAVLWIIRGFKPKEPRQPKTHPQLDKRVEEIRGQKEEGRLKPASTVWLIISIIFSPILWMVDSGAMANFWASRVKKD